MSSILKALKKLEEQTVEENTVLVWPDTLGSKNYRSVSKNRKKYIFLFVTPVLLMGAAGGYMYYHNLSPEIIHEKITALPLNIVPTKPRGHIPPPAIMKKDMNIALDKTPDKEILSAIVPEAPPESVPVTDTITLNDKATVHPPAVKPEKEIKSKFTIRETPGKPDVITADKHSDIRPETVARRKPSKPVRADMSGLDIVEDPRIELQAIAWAPNAKDSFVVINNRIYREGGKVQGIRVLKIMKETVAFQEGTSKWQQEFRVK